MGLGLGFFYHGLGPLPSDGQVSTRARKHQKMYTLALVSVTVQEDSPLAKFVNLLFID